jgi:hypothetical protein
MFRPPAAVPISLDGPAGPLEALIEEPMPVADARRNVAAYGVICHPHPLQGGTMTNKVVHTLARALQEAGLPTIRFNYRGVGKSAGAYDEGRGETLDALAVADEGARRWPGHALWLAGFSFGGYVAVRASHERATARVIAVAPAVTRFAGAHAAGPRCPWLLIQGDADDVIAPDEVLAWGRAQSPLPEIVELRGGSHFFHGRLGELRTAVHDFALR